jgi:hypothetical protein
MVDFLIVPERTAHVNVLSRDRTDWPYRIGSTGLLRHVVPLPLSSSIPATFFVSRPSKRNHVLSQGVKIAKC